MDSEAQAPAAGRPKVIAAWLLALCAMVFAMVVLGGVTRLTHAGLSMVEWKPVTAWLPPLAEAEWQEAFGNYRRFPEYKDLNPDMTLSGFKSIFWLEYVHRLWGRLIGVAFLVPFTVFVVRGWVGWRLAAKLIPVFVLGALQGLLGWYMVQSGLVDRPDVSQYRLAAHLGAAFVIYGYMLWVALGLLFPGPAGRRPPAAFGRFATLVAGSVLVTVLSGGLVAGLDAGFAYNTFPLMDGELVPAALFAMDPFLVNFFEDIATVQFTHRLFALALLAAVGVFWLRARNAGLAPRGRVALDVLAVTAAGQVVLGISTLLLVVPVPLAAAHQGGALVLFTAALWTAYELRPGAGRRKGRRPPG